MAKQTKPRPVEALTHSEASRKNIPTAEYRSVIDQSEQSPIEVAYERRNRDLDPQLVWRGKDEQNWSDLVVQTPPLYIQEKVHPKVLVDDLMQRTKQARAETESEDSDIWPDLFADFNGLPDNAARTEFYQHDANWSNRMILGDSLQVMASLAEREGLRGKVQCIYIDPPYGIKFNSNFQWSTTSRDVRDGKANHVTREPEQVKAFRDTWRDGIHSYLSYLYDRLIVARDLLTESGSIFVQIGEENIHMVRCLLDEVFDRNNQISEIKFRTTSNRTSDFIPSVFDTILVYAKNKDACKFRRPLKAKTYLDVSEDSYGCVEIEDFSWRRLTKKEKLNPETVSGSGRLFGLADLTSSHEYLRDVFIWRGCRYSPKKRYWSTSKTGLTRLGRANRLCDVNGTLRYKRIFEDSPASPLTNIWTDTGSGSQAEDRIYVVQTIARAIERCILMCTDPGDLILDPTCGSGTSAFVAEQWGRRWITIDTSRVALALARIRMMGTRYRYYLLNDSHDGQLMAGGTAHKSSPEANFRHDIRQGFVYQRASRITLKSIANNAEIDTIWEKYEELIEPLIRDLNRLLGTRWKEWNIPRRPSGDWSDEAREFHTKLWEKRIARQREIDASIAARADFEYLYDRPYEDKTKVRVSGPFTVESVSPHRVLAANEDNEFIDPQVKSVIDHRAPQDFATLILENLRTSGVQQAHKEDRISFSSVVPWPGELVCADGRYVEGDDDSEVEKRAAIMIGPEFGSVTRPDLVAAAKEAAEGGFDVLVACAFNFEAHASDLNKLGRVPVLKARMNADLHMADELRNTGKGNLFVIFGEPDIEICHTKGDDPETGQIQVRVKGVDVFHPSTGEIRSDNADGIACWFIDTDYNEESFFVRHAYFLGANDPYKALKTTLKAEINREAWESLRSDTSRPFDRPKSGRIAVKVINHLGDEVMKIFRVQKPS